MYHAGYQTLESGFGCRSMTLLSTRGTRPQGCVFRVLEVWRVFGLHAQVTAGSGFLKR